MKVANIQIKTARNGARYATYTIEGRGNACTFISKSCETVADVAQWLNPAPANVAAQEIMDAMGQHVSFRFDSYEEFAWGYIFRVTVFTPGSKCNKHKSISYNHTKGWDISAYCDAKDRTLDHVEAAAWFEGRNTNEQPAPTPQEIKVVKQTSSKWYDFCRICGGPKSLCHNTDPCEHCSDRVFDTLGQFR